MAPPEEPPKPTTNLVDRNQINLHQDQLLSDQSDLNFSAMDMSTESVGVEQLRKDVGGMDMEDDLFGTRNLSDNKRSVDHSHRVNSVTESLNSVATNSWSEEDDSTLSLTTEDAHRNQAPKVRCHICAETQTELTFDDNLSETTERTESTLNCDDHRRLKSELDEEVIKLRAKVARLERETANMSDRSLSPSPLRDENATGFSDSAGSADERRDKRSSSNSPINSPPMSR